MSIHLSQLVRVLLVGLSSSRHHLVYCQRAFVQLFSGIFPIYFDLVLPIQMSVDIIGDVTHATTKEHANEQPKKENRIPDYEW